MKDNFARFMALDALDKTSEAELADVRVGADGTIYENAGTAVRTQIGELKEDIKNLSDDVHGADEITYTDGNISESGVVSDEATPIGNCKSRLIKSNEYKKILVHTTSPNVYMGYCKYQNGVFVSRISWVSKDFKIINDGYDIILLFACSDSGKTKDDTLNFCSADIIDTSLSSRIETLENEVNTINTEYITKIVCSDTGRNIIHFSVDDTWICINDLITNSSTYTSIFDNEFLSKLKELHDTYGICVTLNTFNTISTDSSYSISNVPTSYQTEFQANKHWLKFAFHAESDVENYNTSTGISTSYDTFVNAIYNLTGDYDCIDRVARLGYFGGTLENVLAIKNKEYGIIGLLCADDTRISYYLTEEQNNIVQKKGKYIDAEHQIFMIKTITRNLGNAVSEINGNLCYQKFVEIFMHEYVGNPTFGTVAEWAKNNGYVSAFPSLLLN